MIEGRLSKLCQVFAFKVSQDLVLRCYADCRPHNLVTSELQKGLVLVRGGKELIEEGLGFGTPVIIYEDRTYFSRTAEMSVLESEGRPEDLSKSFFVDCVSKKRMWNIPVSDHVYLPLSKASAKLFKKRRKSRPVLYKMMKLKKILGWQNHFVRVSPKGRVDVTYSFLPSEVNVEVKTDIEKNGCEEIAILNEQGASFCRRYTDSSGLDLVDEKIGAWEKVEAEEASFSNMDGTLAFTLTAHRDAVLYRGRESIDGILSWAGLAYSLGPATTRFSYSIRVD